MLLALEVGVILKEWRNEMEGKWSAVLSHSDDVIVQSDLRHLLVDVRAENFVKEIVARIKGDVTSSQISDGRTCLVILDL